MKVPILLPNIFDHPFTYESGKIDLKLGDYVTIQFGKSKSTGVVWDKFEKEKKKKYLILKKLKMNWWQQKNQKFLICNLFPIMIL